MSKKTENSESKMIADTTEIQQPKNNDELVDNTIDVGIPNEDQIISSLARQFSIESELEEIERGGDEPAAIVVAVADDSAESKKEEKSSSAAPAAKRKKAVARPLSAAELEMQRNAEDAAYAAQKMIFAAIKDKTILSGEVASVEPLFASYDLEPDETPKVVDIALVVMLNGNIKVMIPYGEIFTRDPLEAVGKASLYQKRVIEERMNYGTIVSFVPLRVEKHGEVTVVIASRRQASETIMRKNFGGRRPKYKTGDIITTTIQVMLRHVVIVDAGGYDAVIPQHKLTLRALQYIGEHYRVGDKIPARIDTIEYGADGNVHTLILDPIHCELADARTRYKMLTVGSAVRGIVTNVYREDTGNNHIHVFAWLPAWNVPARIVKLKANSFGREITLFTELKLRVIDHSEYGYVICVAESEHGSNGYVSSSRK